MGIGKLVWWPALIIFTYLTGWASYTTFNNLTTSNIVVTAVFALITIFVLWRLSRGSKQQQNTIPEHWR